MDWSALPYDMKETILGCLSLRELADVSTTCKRFALVFSQKLAKEQKSRCDLANARFGRKRLARIVEIAVNFHNAQLLDPHSGERVLCYCSISSDGTLHVAGAAPRDPHASRRGDLTWSISQDGTLHVEKAAQTGTPAYVPPTAGDAYVRVRIDNAVAMLIFDVSSDVGSCVSLMFTRGHPRCTFFVDPCNDEDVGGMALVQALLSGEFAPIVGEGWRVVEVHITWGGRDQGFTPAGLDALVGPMLPLVESYTPAPLDWAGQDMVRRCRENRQVASNAKPLIKVHVII
jgi:hypothetical protein